MRHIVTFSGGKDSLATLIWAKKNLPEFEVIFCDTGWEAEATYAHIAEVEQWFGLKIKVLTMPYATSGKLEGGGNGAAIRYNHATHFGSW